MPVITDCADAQTTGLCPDPRAFIARVKPFFFAKTRDCDGHRLTASHMRVVDALAYWPTPWPKHRELAGVSGASISTVQRALKILNHFEVLSWQRQVLDTPEWSAQVANRYEVLSSKEIKYIRLSSSVKMAPPSARIRVVPAPTPLQRQQLNLLEARIDHVNRMLREQRGHRHHLR